MHVRINERKRSCMNLESKEVWYSGRVRNEKRQGRAVSILSSQRVPMLMETRGPEKEEDVMVPE